MAFKRNKFPTHKGTSSHAKMVSSFKQLQEANASQEGAIEQRGATNAEIAEMKAQADADARAQSVKINQQIHDAQQADSEEGTYGVYSPRQAEALMAKGMQNLTAGEINKLARSVMDGGGNVEAGKVGSYNTRAEIQANLEEYYRELNSPKKDANEVEEKKTSEKITEWYFTPDGKAHSKTGHPDPKTGKLPAYEHQGVTTNPTA